MKNTTKTLVLFELGFRPFFLGAGAFGAIAMALWILFILAGLEPASSFSARDWHVHEMIFGYAPAVIAGFLLTAIPNWTGRPQIKGGLLAALSGIWLLGRIAVGWSAYFPVFASIVDSAFLVLFGLLLWREILGGSNKRNIPICVIITLFAVANIAFHYFNLNSDPTDLVERMALGVVSLLLLMVGGRITPAFTNNWFRKQGLEPKNVSGVFSQYFDKIALIVAGISVGGWIGMPESKVVGWLFALAFVLNIIRMLRWNGLSTIKEPLVLILHVGQYWLPVWYGLMAMSIVAPGSIDSTSALHALSAGAIGTMTLAVMTRASLGHSGRPLKAGPGAVAIYSFVVIGAAIRVCVQWLPFDYSNVVAFSGLLWGTGFVLFAILWMPLLVRRRVSG